VDHPPPYVAGILRIEPPAREENNMTPEKMREQLAEYLESHARWRDAKAEEHPGDARNQRAADGLDELAAQVRALPDDDPILGRLQKQHQATGRDIIELMPADEAESGVSTSKFRFHDPREPGREFLERLVQGVEEKYVDVQISPLRWSDGNTSDAAWQRAQFDAEPVMTDYDDPEADQFKVTGASDAEAAR
jgi:hypothetical protein